MKKPGKDSRLVRMRAYAALQPTSQAGLVRVAHVSSGAFPRTSGPQAAPSGATILARCLRQSAKNAMDYAARRAGKTADSLILAVTPNIPRRARNDFGRDIRPNLRRGPAVRCCSRKTQDPTNWGGPLRQSRCHPDIRQRPSEQADAVTPAKGRPIRPSRSKHALDPSGHRPPTRQV